MLRVGIGGGMSKFPTVVVQLRNALTGFLADLFPLTTPVVDPFTPDSPNLVPQDSIRIPVNPNKRFRISNFTEENILPDNERRKRSKPERLTYE